MKLSQSTLKLHSHFEMDKIDEKYGIKAFECSSICRYQNIKKTEGKKNTHTHIENTSEHPHTCTHTDFGNIRCYLLNQNPLPNAKSNKL